MSVAKEKANMIASRVCEKDVDKAVAFDILTITAIISAIYHIVWLLKNCGVLPNDAVDKLKNPGIIARWKANRIIKKHLKDKGKDHIYGEVKLAMYESIPGFTNDDLIALYNEHAVRTGFIEESDGIT